MREVSQRTVSVKAALYRYRGFGLDPATPL